METQDHYCDHNQEQDQDQDQDQDRIKNNVSGNFLNGYSSHDDHVLHLQTSYNNNNGGVLLGLHESNNNNHQFPANRIINLNPQGEGPIGLLFEKSPSVIKELESNLNNGKKLETHEEQLVDDQPKKLKATNVQAAFLKIGSWKWESKNEGDLVAKFYYGRKKLIWEFLYQDGKKKIEIRWPQISAINSFVQEDKNGVLEVELNEPPEYYKEKGSQPGKHTMWEPSDDFTEGQAPVCRRHTVVFLPRVLDEAFKKLLQCDRALLNISRQPFPTHNSPLFCNQKILDFSNNRSVVVHGSSSVLVVSNHGSSSVPAASNNDGHQGTFQNILVQPASSFIDHTNSNLPMPDLEFSDPDEPAMRASFNNQRVDGIWEQSGNSQLQDISFQPIEDHLYIPKPVEESSIPDQEPELILTDIQNIEFSNNLSSIPDLQQQSHLTEFHNPNADQFASNQNLFEVESSACNPFKQNHQINSSLQPSGGNINGMIDGFIFDDFDQSLETNNNTWNPMETRLIHDSNNNHMAYVDEDLCRSFSFMEPTCFLPSEFSIQDFNNMMNLESFIPSGGNGELAVQNPNYDGPN